jgi:hypothetical protein
MIRALALLCGLVAGVALAVVLHGRMAHLRAVADLPAWTGAIAPDARVTAGRATLPQGFTLDWRLARVGLSGPVWTGRVQRADARLDLTAHLQRLPGAGLHLWLRVDPGSATLSGAGLAGHFPSVLGTGSVTGAGLSLDLDAAGQRLRWRGDDLPDGPVNLNLWPGGWRLAAGAGLSETGTDLVDLLGD